MTPLWITKHQTRLPSVLVTVLPLTSDPNTSSLRDNQLNNEINAIRGVFNSTSYRTKLVVLFVCEEGEETPYDIDDRLSIIRRATNLDQKTSFYLAPEVSQTQLEEFVKNLLATLQPSCVEYYRDLSKHARRKRNRGSPPPPTAPPAPGQSQILSQQGWNVRYEFKLGVLAEFRQEMDAACRNFESAYEGLFSQELFESIPSWSRRFNEARMLADIIAVRIIRCLLSTGQTTTAVRSWDNHKDRVQDIVRRRGKGTDNYGWEAWEATWSKTMAQLVDTADVEALSANGQQNSQTRNPNSIYCYPEKSIPIGERVPPWHLLHHQGYWLTNSQKHTQRRRILARSMPEEDRSRPGESPASVIASKAHLYDTYLAPAPYQEFPVSGADGFDHTEEIVTTLRESINHFSSHRQFRAVERLYMALGQALIAEQRWQDALQVLASIWESLSWRRSAWYALVDEIGWAIHECALKCNDQEHLLRVTWELHSLQFTKRPDFDYNLRHIFGSLEPAQTKPAIVLRADNVASPIVPSFAFLATDGNVGESLHAQLIVQSNAQTDSVPIRLSEVKIVFEGGLRSIRLLSDESEALNDAPTIAFSKVQLRDSTLSADSSDLQTHSNGIIALVGNVHLELHSGQTRIFDLSVTPREAGEVKVASVTLLVNEEQFSLTSVTSGTLAASTSQWYSMGDRVLSRPLGPNLDVTMARILPKPPKLAINVLNVKDTYYTNEDVQLSVDLSNMEDIDTNVKIEVQVHSPAETGLKVRWDDGTDEIAVFPAGEDPNSPVSLSLSPRSFEAFGRHTSKLISLMLSNTEAAVQYDITIFANYTLVSEPDTPMEKVTTVAIPFIRPFEANYDFLPRLDPTPWPNFFDMPNDDVLSKNRDTSSSSGTAIPEGLSQRFVLTSKLVSFATETLEIETVTLMVDDVKGGAVCRVETDIIGKGGLVSEDPNERHITPGQLQEDTFGLLISKLTLADRRPVGLDLALTIRWRRLTETSEAAGQSTVSTLAIPRFVLPMAEPRVLLTTSPNAEALGPVPGFVTLHYTLENPSLHFLTFSLTMESSEDFAFSGPKSTNLSLVPLSRHSVTFRLLSTKKDLNAREQSGTWLRSNLMVVDQGFRKTLRVLAAADGVKQDKRGAMVWVE